MQRESLLSEDLNHVTDRSRKKEISGKAKYKWNENVLGHSISQNIIFLPSEDSDQSTYLRGLIRIFIVRLKTLWVFGYLQSAVQRLTGLLGYAG